MIIKAIIYVSLFSIASLCASDIDVQITKDVPYVNVVDSGKKIKIERIQDIQNKLTDDFAKTSRECPPFCIVPIRPDKDIKTIEELELLAFMKKQITEGTGLIVDVREPKLYDLETIPTAVNIPFSVIEGADKKRFDDVFEILGTKVGDKGSNDYSNSKTLAVFCSGVWCRISSTFILEMAKAGYPKDKLLFYRSGLQGWKLLGLTTTIRKENVK